MDARRVLVESGRDLMFGLLDGYTVDVVDLLSDLVIAELVGTAGERQIVGGDADRRAGLAQDFRLERGRQARHVIAGRSGALVAFAHHDPAHIFEHRL